MMLDAPQHTKKQNDAMLIVYCSTNSTQQALRRKVTTIHYGYFVRANTPELFALVHRAFVARRLFALKIIMCRAE